jgi:hypothetical protein
VLVQAFVPEHLITLFLSVVPEGREDWAENRELGRRGGGASPDYGDVANPLRESPSLYA